MDPLTSDELAKNEGRAIAMSCTTGCPAATRAALANFVERSGKLRLRLMVAEQDQKLKDMKAVSE